MKPLARTLIGLAVGWLVTRLLTLLSRFHSSPRLAQTAHRRNFIRNAALGAAGIATAVSAALFGGLMWPNKLGAFGGVVTVGKADVPAPDTAPFRHNAGHFYLVHNDDGLLALWWKCPHLGCTVPWVGPPDSSSAFQCPCHGSMYTLEGVLTGGPAPRPMDLMAVSVDDAGNVQVNTGAITQRTAYAPEQATKYTA
jgi:cytochrome b6-f complex iron-sulfur subunit